MITNIPARTVTFLLAACIIFLPGCRNYLVPEKGSSSLKNARIDYPEEGVGEAEWQGKHLDIKYSISQNSVEPVISGTVTIHDQVLMSFDRLERLVVKMSFLDDSGSVLGTVDITPNYAIYDQVRGPLNFKNTGAPVAGASSFAFSYFGTLFGRLAESEDSLEIFYFPFD